MDYNTNSGNSPEYYRNRGVRCADYNRGPQRPRGDYNVRVTPAAEAPAADSPAVSKKPPLPESLRGIFNGGKKKYGLRLFGVILAAVLVLCAFASAIALYIAEQNSAIANAGNSGLIIQNNLKTYAVPAGEQMALPLEDITREQVLTPAEIYEQVVESVVDVMSVEAEGTSKGTGIIISDKGLIITNQHVVENSLGIYVTLHNGRIYEGMLVGTHEGLDIAVIKIDAPGLKAAHFADSDQLKVGEGVVAIGDPTNYTALQSTMTAGIISALNREMDPVVTLIQTDAAINSGNSGGPLVNEYGQVVGIVVLKITAKNTTMEGLGFALPISSIKAAIDAIIETGEFETPNLGITAMTLDAEASAFYRIPQGVLVDSVSDKAAKNGCAFRAGDIILSMDGKTVESLSDLNDIKFRHRAGETLSVTVLRENEETEINVTLLRDDQV